MASPLALANQKIAQAQRGAGVAAANIGGGDTAEIADTLNRMTDLVVGLQGKVDNMAGGGASCGCDPSGDGAGYQQAEGYLPVAGAEDEIAAAGPYTLTINIQGRPAAGSKLMMQTSTGIFSVTGIKVGTFAMQFGDFIPGFVLDPRNQIGFGVEIDVPDRVWASSQSIVITGNVSAACTVQAELVSNNPETFKTFSCGPKGQRYATALGLRSK